MGGVGGHQGPVRAIEDRQQPDQIAVVFAALVPALADVARLAERGQHGVPAMSPDQCAVDSLCAQDVGLAGEVGLPEAGVTVPVSDPPLMPVADDVVVQGPAANVRAAVSAGENAVGAGDPVPTARNWSRREAWPRVLPAR